MPSPDQVFLRDRSGRHLGPLEIASLEVLFCADIVDDKTPVSADGQSFIPLGRHPDLMSRVSNARDRLAEGKPVWDSVGHDAAADLLDEPEAGADDVEDSEVPTDPPPPPTVAASTAPLIPSAPPMPRQSEPPPRAPRPSRPTAPPPPPVQRPPAPQRPIPPAATTVPGGGLDLAVHSASRILFDHAIDRSTGRLRFSTDFGRIDCCLVDGVVSAIETDMDLLALDQFLVNKGAVGEDAIVRARRKMPDAELGHALIGLGLIEPHVFMDALGRWARTTLSWIVALEEGRAELIPEQISAPAVPTGLDRFSCLVQAIREGVQRDQINAAFAPHLAAPLMRSQLDGVELDELKLDPRELRALKSVDGARTLGEIMDGLKGTEVALLSQRALFIGFVSRFLVVGEARARARAQPAPEAPPKIDTPPPKSAPSTTEKPEAPARGASRSPLRPPTKTAPRRSPLAPPGSGAAPPAAPAAAATPAPTSAAPKTETAVRPAGPPPNDAYEVLRLKKELEALQGLDPFKVIGVNAGSSDQDVRNKFMSLAKKYHPDAAHPASGAEVTAIRQEFFAFLQHMYDQIKTTEQRAEFKFLVDEGIKSREEEQELVRAILDAESCFLKAEAMVKSRRWKEALAEIEEGLRLKRGDREMEIYKAYIEAMIDGNYPKAIRRITELLGKDENLLSAFLFLARLQKAAGDMEAAVKMFKRVQQLDAHNNEAASEIRLVNMRKEKEKKKGRWF